MIFLYKGVIEDILPVQTFSSGFTKRDIVIGNDVDNPSKYPNPVKFSFKKDNVNKISAFKKGDRVTVRFCVDGRRWESPKGVQYFVDLTGIDIGYVDQALNEKKGAAPEEADGHENETVVYGDDGVADDIPF